MAPSTDTIIAEILHREGWPVVTNRPADDGGLTKGGITYNNYCRWLKKVGRPVPAPTEFVLITEDQAREFLLNDIAGPLYQIADVNYELFSLVFDWATTSGPDDPTRALQVALRQMGHKITIDGVYGSDTDAALVACDSQTRDIVRELVAKARVTHYVKVALRDDDVKQFRASNPTTNLENLNGWINRALEFL